MLKTLLRRAGARIIARSKPHSRPRTMRWLASLEPHMPSAYGPLIRVRQDDFTARLCLHGGYGTELSELIEGLPTDAIFLDVGANLGLYSLLAGQRLSEGTVFAFEPNPAVFADLVSNIHANRLKNVVPFNAAVAGESALMTMAVHRGHTGAAHFDDSGSVQVAALDPRGLVGLWAGKDAPIFVKVDVEGYECVVVAALLEALRGLPVLGLYVELSKEHVKRSGQGSVDEVYVLLAEHGFQPVLGRKGKHYDELFLQQTDGRGRADLMGVIERRRLAARAARAASAAVSPEHKRS